MFFNLGFSVYMAVFLTPYVITCVPAATETAYGYALVLMCVGIATLLVSYGLTFACLSGQLRAEFPKAFDSVGAGFLGFLTGFLVCSFVAFALALTPLCRAGDPEELSFFQKFGFEAQSQSTNTSYMCFWCNRYNGMLAYSDSPLKNSDMAVRYLLRKAAGEPKAVPPVPEAAKTAEAGPDAGKASPPPPAPTATPAAPPENKSPFESVPGATQPEGSPAAGQPKPEPAAKPAAPADPMEEELGRRRVIINAPADADKAIANPDIKIIEVADDCTGDKFDDKQSDRLQDWVSKGGVLWATNDVLVAAFGIRQKIFVGWSNDSICAVSTAAEVSPIAADCKRVALRDVEGKAHGLSYKGAVALLTLEKDTPKHKAGTVCWSLVPYGKGWISDRKTVDTTQLDGAVFWRNFCQFCLRSGAGGTATGEKASGGEKSSADGPLTGLWQAGAFGARFRIADDKKAITVEGLASNTLQNLNGKLTLRQRWQDP